MSRLLKIGLWLIGAILAAAIGLAVAVAFLFEPEDYRPYIIDVVEQSTGRSFDLGGELGLKLFPCCSVSVGAASLGNPPDFPAEHFARIAAGDFSLEIWPLLSRQEIRIGQVTLEGLELALVQLADGRDNWTFADSEEPPGAGSQGDALPEQLSVAGVRVRNAKIGYQDQQTGAVYRVEEIELATGPIASLEPSELAVDFELSLRATDAADGTTAHLKLESALSGSEERFVLRGVQMVLDASGPQIPARRIAGLISADSLELVTAGSMGLKVHAATGDIQLESLEGLTGDVLVSAGAGLVELDLDALTGRLSGLAVTATGFDSEISLNAAGEFGGVDRVLNGDLELHKVGLRKVMAALGIEDLNPADDQALTRLTGSMRWRAGSDHLTLQDVSLGLDDSELTGTLAIRDFATPATRFDLALDRIDVERYLPAPVVSSAGGGPVESTRIPLDTLKGLNVDGDLQIRKLKVRGLDLADVKLAISEKAGRVALSLGGRAVDGTFRLEGRGDVAAAEPALDGTLELNTLSPRKLLQALEADTLTADPAALSALSGATRWRLGRHNLSLEQMNWRLDQSTITGALAVDDLDTLAVRFDLSLDRMNLDGYLAPDDTGSQAADPSEPTDFELPVELIRDLRLDGKLAAGQITVAKLNLQNLSAQVRAADGVLELEPLQASLYGGSYRGNIRIDATGPKARLTLAQQISAVQVAEVLKNLYDSDRLAGALTLQLDGSGTGNTRTELLKALTGNVSMSLSDGVYRGMDVVYEVQRAQSLLRQTPQPAVPAKQETAIRTLSFAGRMVDGVLGTDQLSAEIPFLRLAGKGGINLVEMALDYQLNAQVLRDADSPAARGLNELANTTIPLTIKGPMASPRVGVDLKNLVSTAVRDTVQERAREALLKRLGGTRESAEPAAPVAGTGGAQSGASETSVPPETTADSEQAGTSTEGAGLVSAPAQPAPVDSKPESAKDLLKRGLRDLLKPPVSAPAPAPTPAPAPAPTEAEPPAAAAAATPEPD